MVKKVLNVIATGVEEVKKPNAVFEWIKTNPVLFTQTLLIGVVVVGVGVLLYRSRKQKKRR